LKEMVPQAARLAWVETREIRDRDNAVELEQGRKVGLTRVGPPLNHPIDETEYRRLFAALAQEGAEMIAVTEDAENVTNLRLIIFSTFASIFCRAAVTNDWPFGHETPMLRHTITSKIALKRCLPYSTNERMTWLTG